MKDIIFITVDCWRYDAPNRMPRLDSIVDEWHSGSVICASAATNSVFPAIFTSQFYPEIYEPDGSLPDDLDSLPSLLSEQGYTTAGFVASNPYLGKWSSHFDTWWNDGMAAKTVDENRHQRKNSLPYKIKRFVRLKPYVPAEDVLARADEWWDQAESPRFLWLHFMEPHGPYLPGLRRGKAAGLLKTYASLFLNAKRDGADPDWVHQQLKRLHYQCVDRLDSALSPWLASHDGVTVILTADHGEEFDHGMIGHERLYDETVRVPLFVKNAPEAFNEADLIRQLDLAPFLLDRLQIEVPDPWEGRVALGKTEPQEMVSNGPVTEKNWVGIRSKSWKIIRTYDRDEGWQGSETYHISEDPFEKTLSRSRRLLTNSENV